MPSAVRVLTAQDTRDVLDMPRAVEIVDDPSAGLRQVGPMQIDRDGRRAV